MKKQHKQSTDDEGKHVQNKDDDEEKEFEQEVAEEEEETEKEEEEKKKEEEVEEEQEEEKDFITEISIRKWRKYAVEPYLREHIGRSHEKQSASCVGSVSRW